MSQNIHEHTFHQFVCFLASRYRAVKVIILLLTLEIITNPFLKEKHTKQVSVLGDYNPLNDQKGASTCAPEE